MSTVATLLALTVSLVSLLYLRHVDAKRRRAFHLPVWGTKRYSTQAWVLCLLPGLVLLGMAMYAAFIMWFAAFSLVGWIVALKKPVA